MSPTGGQATVPIRLGVWPTPLPLDGAEGVYMKREDLCGFAFGGSQVRAVEPLLEHAVQSGAETVVVGGRRDSNWVALAGIAASRVGLDCHCIFDPGAGTTSAMKLAGTSARPFGSHRHPATVRSVGAGGSA